MSTSLEDVKEYWAGKNIPQQWYSDKEPFTLQWFNDLAKKRYELYYEYLKHFAEFQCHAGEKVLEVGCGLGTDLVEFAKNGAEVYGIDLGEDQVGMSKLNFETRNIDYAEIKTGNAEDVPYGDGMFDLVYSFGVLHHTPDTEKALAEIHRVLKPDGQVIMMLYARGWKHYVKRCLIHGLLLGKWAKNGFSWQAVYNDVSEVHGGSPKTDIYTKGQVKHLFREFGEVIAEKRRLGEFIEYKPYRSRVMPRFVKNLLHLFGFEAILGENWFIKAYKATPPEPKSVAAVIFKHY